MDFVNCIRLFVLFNSIVSTLAVTNNQEFMGVENVFSSIIDSDEVSNKRHHVFLQQKNSKDVFPKQTDQCIIEKQIPKFSETNLALSVTLFGVQLVLSLILIYMNLKMWGTTSRLAMFQLRREREREILYPIKREHLISKHFVPLKEDNVPKRQGVIIVTEKKYKARYIR